VKLDRVDGLISHFVLTDSDIAVVDDLGDVKKHPFCHLGLTVPFITTKANLNFGFVAIRGASTK
jgi:hypothetical protein